MTGSLNNKKHFKQRFPLQSSHTTIMAAIFVQFNLSCQIFENWTSIQFFVKPKCDNKHLKYQYIDAKK